MLYKNVLFSSYSKIAQKKEWVWIKNEELPRSAMLLGKV
jgi:hypothetical protein